MAKIIDVSRYQGVINWEAVKASGIAGAMLKTVSTNSAYGGIYIDPTFERNYAECKRLGIPVGIYYYTYALDKGYADRELAKVFEAMQGKTFELPIAVDVEDNSLKPLSTASLTDLVAYALKTLENAGYYAILYTYTSYKNSELDMSRLTAFDQWRADYRGENYKPAGVGMWQYTSSGTVPGINGNVDLSYSYKDYPAIIKKAGLNGYTKTAPQQPRQEEKHGLLYTILKGVIQAIFGGSGNG